MIPTRPIHLLQLNNSTAAGRLARIFGIHVLLLICWVVLSDVVFDMRDFETSVESGFEKSPLLYALFAITVAPLWEEAVFRLPFIRNRYMWMAVMLGVMFFLGVELLALKILTGVYILFVCMYWVKQNVYLKFAVIAISVILFGLIHIGNYSLADIEQMNGLEFVASFISQLVLGIILTFVRLTYSFKHAVAYHVAFNGILISFGLILGS